jgi:hypothetical protein
MNYNKYVLFFTILLLSCGDATGQGMPYVFPQDSDSVYKTPYFFPPYGSGSTNRFVMMPPQLLEDGTSDSYNQWKARPDTVVLVNTSSGVMHFSEEGLNFDVDGKHEKTITLPPGKNSQVLTYSIQGQQNQITVVLGHRYSLYFDVQHLRIIAHDF